MSIFRKLKVYIYLIRNAQSVCQCIELASSTGYAMDVERVSRASMGERELDDYHISCGAGGCGCYGHAYSKEVSARAQDIHRDISEIIN